MVLSMIFAGPSRLSLIGEDEWLDLEARFEPHSPRTIARYTEYGMSSRMMSNHFGLMCRSCSISGAIVFTRPLSSSNPTIHDVRIAGQVRDDLQGRDGNGRSERPPREFRIHRQLAFSRARGRPTNAYCCPTRVPDTTSSRTWTEAMSPVRGSY